MRLCQPLLSRLALIFTLTAEANPSFMLLPPLLLYLLLPFSPGQVKLKGWRLRREQLRLKMAEIKATGQVDKPWLHDGDWDDVLKKRRRKKKGPRTSNTGPVQQLAVRVGGDDAVTGVPKGGMKRSRFAHTDETPPASESEFSDMDGDSSDGAVDKTNAQYVCCCCLLLVLFLVAITCCSRVPPPPRTLYI